MPNRNTNYIKDSYLKPRGRGSVKKIIFLLAGILLSYPIEKTVSGSESSKEGILYNKFDEKQFEKHMYQISLDLKRQLSVRFPGHRWSVRIVQIKRTLEQQKAFQNRGLSQTGLGLHQFGAACDFEIKVDGQTVTGTGKKNGGLVESLVPYRILGGVAQKYGYFWGLPWDSGHIATHRYVADFLEENPRYLNHPDVTVFYHNLISQDSIDIKYQKFVDMIDQYYGITASRHYVGKLNIDQLLTPL